MRPHSYADLLADRVRRTPGQPLVTYYDGSTGERTELSVTTYANWVSKTAGVLLDDLDLTAGESVRIGLGTHWLGPVFVGAALLAGLTLAYDEPADLRIRPAGRAAPGDLACSLHPFALACPPGTLPEGVQDFGTLWPNQPDVLLAPPGLAIDAAEPGLSQSDLLGSLTPTEDRTLTRLDPGSRAGVRVFLSALAGTGSVVWVTGCTDARCAEIARAERVTRSLDQPPS